jgi:transcriptional regulator with XRE-family HTH domain
MTAMTERRTYPTDRHKEWGEEQTLLYRSLGRRAQEARQALGLRQEDLARLVGVTRPSIANMESGRQRTPLHTLVEIARALEVDPSWLLFGTGPAPAGLARGLLARLRVLEREIAELRADLASLEVSP